MIIRIIIMITIFIIIIMRMLRASCAQLEEAKQGSFTYNQGYHRLKWGEAPCFNSKWGQFLTVTQPTLFVGHCYCWSICGCMMFSRSAHSSKLQKTNAGTWVRLKMGFFFSSISLYPKHITQMEETMIRWTTKSLLWKTTMFQSVNLIEPNGPWLPVRSVE